MLEPLPATLPPSARVFRRADSTRIPADPAAQRTSPTAKGAARPTPFAAATRPSLSRSAKPAHAAAVLLRAALALASLLGSFACAQGVAPTAGPALGLHFAGPGRMLVVFERGSGRRELVLLEPGGSRRLEVPPFREARFVKPDLLLLVLEAGEPEDSAPTPTQLALHDLATGATKRFGPVGQHYDPEPSPDGHFVAVGSERPQIGEADLEIWSLDGVPQPVALRAQPLEEPRWRDDSQAIAVAQLLEDPESDDDTGGGFGLSSLAWPRLQRLPADLKQAVQIDDGAEPGQLAPGGSLPLWWDGRGVFARQSVGLVRCEPKRGGCARVFAPEPERRIADGRPVGASEAWLLTVEASDAFDRRQPDAIVRIDVESGAVLSRWRAPPGVSVVDLDWKGPTQRYVQPEPEAGDEQRPAPWGTLGR